MKIWARVGATALVGLVIGIGAIARAQDAPAPEAQATETEASGKADKKPAAKAAKPAKQPDKQKAQPAPAVKAKVKTVGNWTVTCPVDPAQSKFCSASMQMIDQKRKLRLLTITIGRNAKGTLLLEAVTPTGVMISPGVVMQTGKIKTKAPYVSCADAGCLTRYAITDSLKAALVSNAPFKFTVAAMADKTVNIEAKPQGTAEALAELGE